MIGYVTIGALEHEAARTFYDAVFGTLGGERKFEDGTWIGYGMRGGGKGFEDCHTMICAPYDQQPAKAGNGIMIAYQADARSIVEDAYAAGLAAGGRDEGAPGFRPAEAQAGFYGAYLRDPTGNKLCLFCIT